MYRAASYVLALTCIASWIRVDLRGDEHRPQAIRVLLGTTCRPESENNRLLVVRYLPGERFYLNDQLVNEAQLRHIVTQAVERRIEKIVWIAADERVTYGGVIGIISKLQSDTPSLHIAIATESQIGPVEPFRSSAWAEGGQMEPSSALCRARIRDRHVNRSSSFRENALRLTISRLVGNLNGSALSNW